MVAHPLAPLVMLTLLSGPAMAQGGPRIDALTGEPVRPRVEHPRPEPDIFNAPHAPRQERRGDDLPIEVYVAPQMGGLQNDRSPTDDTRRFRSRPPRRDDGFPR